MVTDLHSEHLSAEWLFRSIRNAFYSHRQQWWKTAYAELYN